MLCNRCQWEVSINVLTDTLQTARDFVCRFAAKGFAGPLPQAQRESGRSTTDDHKIRQAEKDNPRV